MKAKYVQAVKELFASGQKTDVVLGNLRTVLQKKGHERLYRSILLALLQDLEQIQGQETSRVTVASEKTLKNQKQAIEKAIKNLGGTDQYETATDGNLIGGFIVEAGEQRLDMSYKTALLQLYRKITN